MTKLRHPPFRAAPAVHHGDYTPDYTTQEGARILAGRIRDAWAAIGFSVQVEVKPLREVEGEWRGQYIVRLPQLVNGLPPGLPVR
jgi:hypothetical protein